MQSFLFSFEGRGTRSDYWLFHILYTFAMALGLYVLGFVVSDRTALSVMSLVLLWPVLANAWRRCHDRGRSGWVLFLPLAVCVAVAVGVWFLAMLLLEPETQTIHHPGGLPVIVAVAFGIFAAFVSSIWLGVELYLLRGTAGINPYGMDPLQLEAHIPSKWRRRKTVAMPWLVTAYLLLVFVYYPWRLEQKMEPIVEMIHQQMIRQQQMQNLQPLSTDDGLQHL